MFFSLEGAPTAMTSQSLLGRCLLLMHAYVVLYVSSFETPFRPCAVPPDVLTHVTAAKINTSRVVVRRTCPSNSH